MKGYKFDEIKNLCPALIKDGCIHGYVMEFININSIESGIELCEKTTNTRVEAACVHALGHSYLEFNHQTLQEAIYSLCKKYSGVEYTGCVSGLFHEYSKAGKGMRHENYYERSRAFNNFSCNGFTGQDYTICYGAQGSFRQYYPESELINETYNVCDGAQTKEATEACRYNALQRLDIARGYSFVFK